MEPVNSLQAFSAQEMFSYLDKKDGKVDNKIQANVWNDFAQVSNGKKIQYCISKDRAIKSINYYLKKNTGETRELMQNFCTDTFSRGNDNPVVGKQVTVEKTTKPQPVVSKQEPAVREKSGSNLVSYNEPSNFEKGTQNLNSRKYFHTTHMLDILQDDLGLYEITREEFNYLQKNNPEELNNTQYKIIGIHGQIDHQWCAHTASFYSLKAGMDIGSHKSTVQQFINWAGEDYKSIKTNKMDKNNYLEERLARATQIRNQIENMHEGDFIIWKANNKNNGSYLIELDTGGFKNCESSHIGFIESVDIEKGIVTVIEGNANVYKTAEGSDSLSVVKKSSEGRIGAQMVGEFKEVNKRDGLIRKQYTIDDLAKYGYSGYIDNTARLETNYFANK